MSTPPHNWGVPRKIISRRRGWLNKSRGLALALKVWPFLKGMRGGWGEQEVSGRWAGGEQGMSGKWAVVEVQELHLCITLHLLLRTLNLSRLDLDLCKAICWRKYCQRYNRPRRWQVKTGKKWPNFKRPEDPLNLVQIKNPFGSFQCDPQAYAWWVPPFFLMKILNLGTP